MEKHPLPGGIWPVLLTPFDEKGEVDYGALVTLLDFYLEAGVEGIFANCMSSEVLHLTPGERLSIGRHVVEHVDGRVPVVAGGNFGSTLKKQACFMNALRDTGVDAVIILLSVLPEPDDLTEQIEVLCERVEGWLGVYESPLPEHRQLDAAQVARIARNLSMVFMKETSREPEIIVAKIHAATGSNLRVMPAHLKSLPDCLKAGINDFCGTTNNIMPRLMRELLRQHQAGDVAGARRTFKILLEIHDAIPPGFFHLSAKYLLGRMGLPIRPRCRRGDLVQPDRALRETLDAAFEKLIQGIRDLEMNE